MVSRTRERIRSDGHISVISADGGLVSEFAPDVPPRRHVRAGNWMIPLRWRGPGHYWLQGGRRTVYAGYAETQEDAARMVRGVTGKGIDYSRCTIV